MQNRGSFASGAPTATPFVKKCENTWFEIKLKAFKAISNFTQNSNYKILQGDHVIELIPTHINKGKAIAYFMKKPPFSKNSKAMDWRVTGTS